MPVDLMEWGGAEKGRTHSRFGVHWDATCRPARGGWAEGMILDASPYGIFVRSEPGRARIGDRMRLKCVPCEPDLDSSLNVVDVEGVVRWVGYSSRHGCYGIGIKLLTRSVAVAVHLTPGIAPGSPLSVAVRQRR